MMEIKTTIKNIGHTLSPKPYIEKLTSSERFRKVKRFLPHLRHPSFEKKMHTVKHYHTLRECLYDVCALHASRIAYQEVVDKNSEQSVTYADLFDRVRQLGTALLKRELGGAHIAVIGENSIDWMSSYLSIVCGTGVAVPIDRELDENVMQLQLNYCDAQAAFVSATSLNKVKNIMAKCPAIKYWFLMRPQLAKESADGFVSITELLQEGNLLLQQGDAAFEERTVLPEDLCDIIFTSGTTGANKGVMLTHKNIAASAAGSVALIGTAENSFSVLPINHAYEKNCNILGHLFDGKTVFINDSLAHIVPNIKRFEPQFCIMVPQILEIIVKKIRAKVADAGLEKTLAVGVQASNALRRVGIDKRERIFRSVLSVFGPNLRRVVCGGAPLKEDTRIFLDQIGITVINGYGISECAPLVSANFSDYQKPGSIGYVMPGCTVRIADPDENGEGEIQVMGDNVMLGYYKDPESTDAVFTEDGWFRTGDLGHMDSDGFLYISGRIKNLIILANGKNVSPEELEEMLSEQIPYLSEVVVYADEENTGIYASCYLDPDYLENNGIDDAYAYMMNDIQKFNQSVPSFKRIRDILISDEEFEKTTTKKIRRFKVQKLQDKNK